MSAGGDDVLRSLGFDGSGDSSIESESEDGSVDIDALLGGTGAANVKEDATSNDAGAATVNADAESDDAVFSEAADGTDATDILNLAGAPSGATAGVSNATAAVVNELTDAAPGSDVTSSGAAGGAFLAHATRVATVEDGVEDAARLATTDYHIAELRAALDNDEELPDGWDSAVDPESKMTYYFKVGTQDVQWEKPTEAVGVGEPVDAVSERGGGENFDIEGLLGDTSSQSSSSSHRSSPRNAVETDRQREATLDQAGIEGISSASLSEAEPKNEPHETIVAPGDAEAGSSSDEESVDVDELLAVAQKTSSPLASASGPALSSTISEQPAVEPLGDIHDMGAGVRSASVTQNRDPGQQNTDEGISHGSHATSSSDDEALTNLAMSMRASKHVPTQESNSSAPISFQVHQPSHSSPISPPKEPDRLLGVGASPSGREARRSIDPKTPNAEDVRSSFHQTFGATATPPQARASTVHQPAYFGAVASPTKTDSEVQDDRLEQAWARVSELANSAEVEQVQALEERLRLINKQLDETKAKVTLSRKAEQQTKQDVQDLRNLIDQAEAHHERFEEQERRATAEQRAATLESAAIAEAYSREALLRSELSEIQRDKSARNRLLTKHAGTQSEVNRRPVGQLSDFAAACLTQLQNDHSLLDSQWANRLSDEDLFQVLLEVSKHKRKARLGFDDSNVAMPLEDCGSTGDALVDQLLRESCAANDLAHEEAELEAQCEALRHRCLVKTDISQFDSQVRELRQRLALQAEVLQQLSECSFTLDHTVPEVAPQPSPVRSLAFSPEPRRKCSEADVAVFAQDRQTYSHTVQAALEEFASLNVLIRQETVAQRVLLASEIRGLHDELVSTVSHRAHAEESLRTAEANRLDNAARQRRQVAQASLEIRQTWRIVTPKTGHGSDRSARSTLVGSKSGNRSFSSSRLSSFSTSRLNHSATSA